MIGLPKPATSTSVAQEDDRARLVLPAIAIGTALAPLNSTMIAVALPSIQSAFSVSLAETAWLVVIYLVTMAVGQPICGRLGDMYGRRRMYLMGLMWFGTASAACIVAPSLPWLIMCRGQQALAGALCIPNGMALVRESVPVENRARSFGVIGMAAMIAAASGPPLGGVLVDLGGWPAIFWANLPVVVVALTLSLRALPEVPRSDRVRARFDYPGSFLLGLSLAAVAVVPVVLERAGGTGLVSALIVAVGAGWLFLLRERWATSPVVDLALFRHRHYAWACASIVMSNFVLYTTILAIPILLQDVWMYGARTTGSVLASMSALAAILGPLSGRWADERGYWLPAVLGALVLVAGTILLAVGTTMEGLALTVGALVTMGLGLGVAGAPVHTAALEAVPHEQTASASGIFSTFRYLGSVTGSTMLALGLNAEVGSGDRGDFTLLFAAMAVPAFLGVIANWRVADRRSG